MSCPNTNTFTIGSNGPISYVASPVSTIGQPAGSMHLDYKNLYKEKLHENTNLENAIHNQTTTDNQRMFHNNEGLTTVLLMNWWLSILYYLLATLLIFMWWYKKTFPYVYLILILLVVGVYPWIIDFLEMTLYQIAHFFFSVSIGVVY